MPKCPYTSEVRSKHNSQGCQGANHSRKYQNLADIHRHHASIPYTGKAAQAAQAAAQSTHGTGDPHHQWRPAGGCCAHHLQILSNFNGQAQKGPRNACGTNLRRIGLSEPSIGWKNAQQQQNSATDPRMFDAFPLRQAMSGCKLIDEIRTCK